MTTASSVLERVPVPLLADDPELVLRLRVAERGAEEEAVELRLGEWERAFELDRVLASRGRGTAGQRPGHAVDRHLPLGHRLEQRGLRLRHRAVDLVDEDDVGEDRAGAELEVACLLVVDREAGDVRGLEVRRALDAGGRRALDRSGDGASEHRLRRSRHVFEEHVTLAGQRGEDELDLASLAVDDGLDVVGQPPRDSHGALEARVAAVGSLRPVHPAPQCRRSPPGIRGLTVHLCA